MRISDWSSDVCSSDLSFIYYLHRRARSPSGAPLQGAAGAAAPQGAAQGLQRPEGQRDAGRRGTRARQQPREPVPRDTKKNFVEISAGPVTIPGRTAAELTGRPGSAGRGIRDRKSTRLNSSQ